MNKRNRMRIIAVLVIVINLFAYGNSNAEYVFPFISSMNVEAASIPTVSNKNQPITIGKQMKIKPSSSYKKPSFKSTNTKVATVSKSGVIKAKMLGETKITVTYKNKSQSYYITVVPAKNKDLRISQNLLIAGKSTQLKFVSDTYDTSHIVNVWT